ncbi:MAG: hypothetical protein GEV12_18315 [Micromonosporaceae bacterium]|nr:hypothetical protein [Micromonosporaceae bacterium]
MRPPSTRLPAATLLVAAVFLTTVELLRAASPLLDLATADLGVVGAAGLAVLIFAAPVLAGSLVALAGLGRTVVSLVLALVLLRLAAQLQDPPGLLVVGAGAALGVAALLLAVRLAPTGVVATVGVLLGTVADLAIRAGLGSWDPVFRPGLVPGLVTGAVAAGALLALVAARPVRRHPGPGGRGGAGRVGTLGPYLALYVMGYGSAPILAAHAGVPAPIAAAVLIGTAVAGIELVRRLRLPGGTGAIREPDRWFSGAVALLGAGGGVVLAYWLAGPPALVGVVLAGLSAAVLLARALTPRPHARRGQRPGVGYAAAGLAAGLGYVVPVMVYQVHYDLQFPFDNRLALVGVAVLLGLAGLGTRPPSREVDRRRLASWPAPVSALAALALLVPLAMVVTGPAVPAADQAGASVRLMSWNLMYGRDPVRGDVDLAAVAEAVEQVDPDVLVLQEVGRGWPIGGGVDMAEWLSRRLRMPYKWAPAANGQFGNALLTRLPYSDVEIERLPFGQGPMERSYLATTLRLAGGRELRLVNTHLQHRKENTPTRLAQTDALLAAWDGAPRTVIAGDFNFWPSWEEADRWEAAGFVSAQDVTGHGAEFTVPSYDPDNRVDWIFGTPDLTFSDFAILSQVTASDHFPLVVTVQVR